MSSSRNKSQAPNGKSTTNPVRCSIEGQVNPTTKDYITTDPDLDSSKSSFQQKSARFKSPDVDSIKQEQVPTKRNVQDTKRNIANLQGSAGVGTLGSAQIGHPGLPPRGNNIPQGIIQGTRTSGRIDIDRSQGTLPKRLPSHKVEYVPLLDLRALRDKRTLLTQTETKQAESIFIVLVDYKNEATDFDCIKKQMGHLELRCYSNSSSLEVLLGLFTQLCRSLQNEIPLLTLAGCMELLRVHIISNKKIFYSGDNNDIFNAKLLEQHKVFNVLPGDQASINFESPLFLNLLAEMKNWLNRYMQDAVEVVKNLRHFQENKKAIKSITESFRLTLLRHNRQSPIEVQMQNCTINLLIQLFKWLKRDALGKLVDTIMDDLNSYFLHCQHNFDESTKQKLNELFITAFFRDGNREIIYRYKKIITSFTSATMTPFAIFLFERDTKIPTAVVAFQVAKPILHLKAWRPYLNVLLKERVPDTATTRYEEYFILFLIDTVAKVLADPQILDQSQGIHNHPDLRQFVMQYHSHKPSRAKFIVGMLKNPIINIHSLTALLRLFNISLKDVHQNVQSVKQEARRVTESPHLLHQISYGMYEMVLRLLLLLDGRQKLLRGCCQGLDRIVTIEYMERLSQAQRVPETDEAVKLILKLSIELLIDKKPSVFGSIQQPVEVSDQILGTFSKELCETLVQRLKIKNSVGVGPQKQIAYFTKVSKKEHESKLEPYCHFLQFVYREINLKQFNIVDEDLLSRLNHDAGLRFIKWALKPTKKDRNIANVLMKRRQPELQIIQSALNLLDEMAQNAITSKERPSQDSIFPEAIIRDLCQSNRPHECQLHFETGQQSSYVIGLVALIANLYQCPSPNSLLSSGSSSEHQANSTPLQVLVKLLKLHFHLESSCYQSKIYTLGGIGNSDYFDRLFQDPTPTSLQIKILMRTPLRQLNEFARQIGQNIHVNHQYQAVLSDTMEALSFLLLYIAEQEIRSYEKTLLGETIQQLFECAHKMKMTTVQYVRSIENIALALRKLRLRNIEVYEWASIELASFMIWPQYLQSRSSLQAGCISISEIYQYQVSILLSAQYHLTADSFVQLNESPRFKDDVLNFVEALLERIDSLYEHDLDLCASFILSSLLLMESFNSPSHQARLQTIHLKTIQKLIKLPLTPHVLMLRNLIGLSHNTTKFPLSAKYSHNTIQTMQYLCPHRPQALTSQHVTKIVAQLGDSTTMPFLFSSLAVFTESLLSRRIDMNVKTSNEAENLDVISELAISLPSLLDYLHRDNQKGQYDGYCPGIHSHLPQDHRLRLAWCYQLLICFLTNQRSTLIEETDTIIKRLCNSQAIIDRMECIVLRECPSYQIGSLTLETKLELYYGLRLLTVIYSTSSDEGLLSYLSRRLQFVTRVVSQLDQAGSQFGTCHIQVPPPINAQHQTLHDILIQVHYSESGKTNSRLNRNQPRLVASISSVYKQLHIDINRGILLQIGRLVVKQLSSLTGSEHDRVVETVLGLVQRIKASIGTATVEPKQSNNKTWNNRHTTGTYIPEVSEHFLLLPLQSLVSHSIIQRGSSGNHQPYSVVNGLSGCIHSMLSYCKYMISMYSNQLTETWTKLKTIHNSLCIDQAMPYRITNV